MNTNPREIPLVQPSLPEALEPAPTPRKVFQLNPLSRTGMQKSMPRTKQTALVILQLLVVMATVTATVIMFLHPACVEHMLAEVARGMSAGVLLSGVKILVAINRPIMVCEPISCWCHFAWATTRHELKCGLIAGFLLGLVVAMRICWHG